MSKCMEVGVIGVLMCWCVDVLVYWCIGVLVCWCVVILWIGVDVFVYLCIGVLVDVAELWTLVIYHSSLSFTFYHISPPPLTISFSLFFSRMI